jgi:hypothetical protein
MYLPNSIQAGGMAGMCVPDTVSPIELVSVVITIDYLGVMASEDGFRAIMLKSSTS